MIEITDGSFVHYNLELCLHVCFDSQDQRPTLPTERGQANIKEI